MKELTKLKKIMIVLFIIIILIFILILKLNKNDQDLSIEEDEVLSNEITEKVQESNDNGFKEIDDPNIFFMVLESLNKYIDVFNYESMEDYTLEENPYEIENEEDKKRIIFSMLDEDYKKENNIFSVDDVIFENEVMESSIIPIEMKVKYGDRIQIYALHVYVENVNDKNLEEKYFIIKTDNINSTFSVKPLDEEYEKIDMINEDQEIEDIEINDYNQYYIDNISDVSLIKLYMEKYRYMAINYPKIVYNTCFDEEYRYIRFGNVDNFENYIQNIKDEMLEIKIMKYSKNIYDNYNEYIIIDQYNNTYIFNESSIMNFTIKLDNYTIPTDKFKETYINSNDEKKVQMNIDKFFQMLNRHDYRSSYNCLADSFKNNYFNTEEEFEEYAKDKFFSYNKIEFKSCEKAGADIYVFKVKIIDLLDEDNQSEVSIIMQLKDDFDFKMSFDI